MQLLFVNIYLEKGCNLVMTNYMYVIVNNIKLKKKCFYLKSAIDINKLTYPEKQ